ncbi:MAG: hypothetical protein DRN66_03440 [Candidatus Nanohalarchaeota archaeon]|nr:MAG: hypothetical protein DRN66_03440 [Candidatus Nanohaloarchaeota archaeon]
MIFDMFLDPLIQLTLISSGLSLVVTLIQKKTIDHVAMKRIRAEIKSLQKDMKEAQKKNDVAKTNKMLARTMELTKKQMMMTMKPTMYTMPLFIIAFPIIRKYFLDVIYTFPMGLGIPWLSLSPFGFLWKTTFGWLGIYIMVSIIASIVFKKIFKMSF